MSKFDLAVTLREITKENWRDILRLKVAPHQEQFVASNAASIAEAHFNPEVAWFRAIYAGDVPVGFLMLEDDVAQQEYFLWRFMIGEQYQGRGTGERRWSCSSRTLRRALERMRSKQVAFQPKVVPARFTRRWVLSSPEKKKRTANCVCGANCDIEMVCG